MAPVTEIAYITFKPGVSLFHESSPSVEVWGKTISTLQQQAGMQRLHYGRLMEEPDTLMLLIDWTSIEHHQSFMSSPQYQPFVNDLLPFCNGIHLHHFKPEMGSPILSTAPVIEFATFFSPSSTFISNMAKFITHACSPAPAGYHGSTYGPSVESDVKKHAEQKEGTRSNAIVLMLGWESKEKHIEFRETQQFKENVDLLRDGAKGVEMFHIEKITTVESS